IGRHRPCDTCVEVEQLSPASSTAQHNASL
ncbi:aquaporin, partial [Klebsiella pneumoniae]|nr:aquaporin [Klebsiella pneumoniae]